jgi:predicted MFS family arabinose efflux permease
LGSLLREPGFLKYWFAHTQSEFGSRLTLLAWPLIAIHKVGASPLQIGILAALERLPYLLFALVVGVYTDRVHKRRMMVIADTGRALVLLAVPVAWFQYELTLHVLYMVAFSVGTFGVIFDIASGAYLPAVIRREQLIDANGKLSTSTSAAETLGPGIAGFIIQHLGAVFALMIDAASYILSAILLGSIHCHEAVERNRSPARKEVFNGLKFVFDNPLLRAIAVRLMAWHAVVGMIETLLMLYLTKELGFSSESLGILLSCIGVGIFSGSFAANYISNRLSPVQTIIYSAFFASLAAIPIPFASGPEWESVLMLGAGLFLYGFCTAVYQINNVSLRQMVTPNGMLGKMNSAVRFVTLGIRPAAAVTAGFLAELVGVRFVIAAAALTGVILATVGLFFSPLRKLPPIIASAEAG